MGFFKRKEIAGGKGYDLLGACGWFVPGGRGFFWIVIMLMLGAILGNCVTLALSKWVSASFASGYGTLFSYPVSFIPAMIYAAASGRANALGNDGVALDSSNFGRFSGWTVAVIAAVATLAAAFVNDAFSLVLPPMPERLEQLLHGLMAGSPLWVSLLTASVFAPFFEEWLCRGIILRGLLQKIGPGWAIVISALFFAVIHLNPWQALPAFVFGCLFGYVYYRTGSLKLTMLMHCVNNTFATLVSRIPGLEDTDSFIELMSPWAYWLEFAACLCIIVAAVAAFSSIGIKDGERSNCDRISFE